MTLLLRKQHAQAKTEGWELFDWPDDDYSIVDDTIVGRIYRQLIHGEPKWLWFLQTDPAPPPNSGMADTLDEAKAAFAKRYAEVREAR